MSSYGFPTLKLHLWSNSMLSKMASTIGRPLFTDRMTAEKERLANARVCVEIKVGSTLPELVILQDEDGNRVMQKVEYEWIPVSCKDCGVFGHTDARCPKKTKMVQQWVVKKDGDNVNIGSPTKVNGGIGNREINTEGSVVVPEVSVAKGCDGTSASPMMGSEQIQSLPFDTIVSRSKEIGECSGVHDQVDFCQPNTFGILEPMGEELEQPQKAPDRGRKKKRASPIGGGGKAKPNQSKQ